VISEAVRRGVWLEINSSPERLDLSANHVRAAKAKGAKFIVSTDAHHPKHLLNLPYGILTARRGGWNPVTSSTHIRQKIFYCATARRMMNLLLIAAVTFGLAAGAPMPDFSGTWKLSNEQSSPKRTGDVTLRIEHRDPELIVETSRTVGPRGMLCSATRRTGRSRNPSAADGDEFHSTVVWNDGTLVFDIVEIEDGKRLQSTELWSLTDGGMTLKRVRRTRKAGEQTLIYVRAG